MGLATVVLGPEFDDELRRRTREALKKIGARKERVTWALAGSQEIGREQWRTDQALLVLEAETYIGLSLTGPDDLVAAIASAVQR